MQMAPPYVKGPIGPGATACKHVAIRGTVQGVGFRPFVYNLAQALDLNGFVANTPAGVSVEVEGLSAAVEAFLCRLRTDLPPLAVLDSCAVSNRPPQGHRGFCIRKSDHTGAMTSCVPPDMATCPACRADIRDPDDRRYRYPFTNCTNCGPRYSIIERMPYDRPYTTMAGFTMCPACRAEYDDPSDRRFHAQPVACPHCGPQLALWDAHGTTLSERENALVEAVVALKAGQIVALKGLGGFQLLVDATNEDAVVRLRTRKCREAKPFALMYRDMDGIRAHTRMDPAHAALLESPQAPIVLVPEKSGPTGLAPSVAPDTYLLGVMLPYTPLHQLLLETFETPLVVTSGNRDEEPICIDEREALDRLSDIADRFLVHDRPITRQVDDSVATVVAGEPMLIRRARGYAPAPLPGTTVGNFLAAGAHLKNSVTFCKNGTLFPSQHIGNLENSLAIDAFERTASSMQRLFDTKPTRVVHDLHPDYASTTWAQERGLPGSGVQHHYAHVLSCMAEHGLDGPVLGVSWDGTGYGTDGTVWGSEFLICTREQFERVASLWPFPLPGGDGAARAPRRCAFSLLFTAFEGDLSALAGLAPLSKTDPQERQHLTRMLKRGTHCPTTTSMGRLFDAVASLCDLCHESRFEGQAAMRLERAAVAHGGPPLELSLPLATRDGHRMLDWRPMIARIVDALYTGVAPGAIALGFHEALANAIVAVAHEIGNETIVLSGGCFQNRLLSENAIYRLKDAGFRVYRHHAVPPNDGGISVGQAWHRPTGESAPCV